MQPHQHTDENPCNELNIKFHVGHLLTNSPPAVSAEVKITETPYFRYARGNLMFPSTQKKSVKYKTRFQNQSSIYKKDRSNALAEIQFYSLRFSGILFVPPSGAV